MASLEEVREERLKKLSRLKAAGIEPYPIESGRSETLASLLKKFNRRKRTVTAAGRVRGLRRQGALVFLDLDDGTAALQGLLRRGDILPEKLELFSETVDLGDFVALSGKPFLTKRKEKTILASDWRMLAKGLRPLPDKWHGLQEAEERFRRRYLDLLFSPEVGERFVCRARIITWLRDFLARAGFLEVETPVLQPLAGGTNARPFVTHHRALDLNLHLRIAEELYLKRLLAGGLPKVYSLAKNFRNEGVDAVHNPEFTMLEWYEAYGAAADQRKLVAKLLQSLSRRLLGAKPMIYQGQKIDWRAPFREIGFYELLRRHAFLTDPAKATREEIVLRARQLGVESAEGESREKILEAVYKKICRPKLIAPTFVIDYPYELLPLAKRLPGRPELADAFQLVAGGLELVKGFSELNDPLDQRERFEAEERARQAGDEEAQPLDEDFLEALEYGMPPAGGVGIGIDRLVMLFTDSRNIREVILFPLLRPRDKA